MPEHALSDSSFVVVVIIAVSVVYAVGSSSGLRRSHRALSWVREAGIVVGEDGGQRWRTTDNGSR